MISLKFYGQKFIRIFSMMVHCDDFNLQLGIVMITIYSLIFLDVGS